MYIKEIIEIIKEINPYIDIDENTELIESEILDSLSVVYIVTELEDKYGIYVDEKLVLPENFKTATLIGKMLAKCAENNNKF